MYADTSCFNPDEPLLNHAVLVVGYRYSSGSNTGGDNFFILMNSWGAGWGEDGFMRIAMVSTPGGIAGMTHQAALYPTLDRE